MLFVIQLFHLQGILALFSRWTASDADNLLVLLKILSCFFFFSHSSHLIVLPPYSHLFPTTNFQPKYDCYWISHVDWHAALLSLSSKPLYFTHTYNTFGSFCYLPYCSSLQLFERSYSLKFLKFS